MVGERIKSLRESKDLRQKDVYIELHLDKSTYSKYENGKLKPSIEVLDKLSRFFDVSSDYILGNIDEPITLTELKFINERKYKDDPEELIHEYDFVDDDGNSISKEDIKKMLDILRANLGD